MRAPSLGVAAVLAIVAAGPVVRAELVVSDELAADAPVPTQDPRGGHDTALATNGDGFFAVWSTRETRARIRATRMTRSGEPLDLVPIELPASPRSQVSPSVAWDGVDWLVVWLEVDPDSVGGAVPREIVAARVSTEGTILDDVPIVLTTVIETVFLRVAEADESAVVSWGFGGPGGVQLARIAGGVLLDPTPITVATDLAYGGATACAAVSCLVVWDECTALLPCPVRARRIDPATGELLDSVPIALPDGAEPRVASDGIDWMVVLLDEERNLVTARVSADGTVTADPAQILSPGMYKHDVTVDGTDYVATWRQLPPGLEGGFAARLSAGGALVEGPIPLGGEPLANGIACATGRCAVPVDFSGWPKVVLVEAGAVVSPSPIVHAHASSRQSRPAVARSAGGWLVVWDDNRASGESEDIRAVLVDEAGVAGSSFAVTAARVAQWNAAAGWDGRSNVIAWVDTSDSSIRAARIDGSGAVDPPGGATVSAPDVESGISPRVACHPTVGCIIAWKKLSGIEAFAVSGIVLPPGAAITAGVTTRFSDESSVPWEVAVAASAHGFLVAWSGFELGGTQRVRGSLVSAAGGIATPGGVRLVDVIPTETERGLGGRIAAASDGEGYFVLWLNADFTMTGAAVDATGRIAEPRTRIEWGPPGDGVPSAIWTGRSYLVAWPGGHDLRAARVSRGGVLLDAPALYLSALDEDELFPAGALGANDATLFAYQRLDWSRGFASERIRFRLLTGDDAPDDRVPAENGCGCRVDRRHDEPLAVLVMMLTGLPLLRRRRR